ncbi:hypothetical protein C8J57DRAFT_1471437 [Mycena rebaudengoi]|nr:hypothetical protein C8J57DRAFT_1471437 [Mycena rebaudengoi]
MQRFFVVLLFSGVVCAILQNFTVDDTSPDITYTNQTFQCNDNNPTNTTCIPTGDYELFNNSATLTTGSITFSFTGTAVYASLDLVGTCSVKVDGNEIATPKRTVSDILADGEQGGLSIFKSDLPNGSHTLVIAPTADGAVIGLDHIIYTADVPGPAKKSHVGAIVGGVIGGVVLTIGALFMALLAHRRKLILRRNQRKSAVLRTITSARPDHKAGAGYGTDLPT